MRKIFIKIPACLFIISLCNDALHMLLAKRSPLFFSVAYRSAQGRVCVRMNMYVHVDELHLVCINTFLCKLKNIFIFTNIQTYIYFFILISVVIPQ